MAGEEPALELATCAGQSGQDRRRLKELRNAKRGLEIRLCNLSAGRSVPKHAGEADDVRNATVELQTVLCEAELAGGLPWSDEQNGRAW
jgi:hypothetical protein